MLSKSSLAICLSRLSGFDSPKLLSEQYATDSEVAADALWFACMQGDVEGRVIADFGCGTGILGIGCLLLGAEKVFFVDNDADALATAAANIKSLKLRGYEIIGSEIDKVSIKADVVVQNPPFGTKKVHADRAFLLKAFKTADVVYSFHKSSTKDFVVKLGRENGFAVTNIIDCRLPVKHQHAFHRQSIKRIDVSLFRLQKS